MCRRRKASGSVLAANASSSISDSIAKTFSAAASERKDAVRTGVGSMCSVIRPLPKR